MDMSVQKMSSPIIIFLLLGTLLSLNLDAQFEQDLQIQQQELNRKIDESNRYLEKLQSTQDAELQELQVIRQTIEDRRSLVSLLEKEMVELQEEAQKTSIELDSINRIKDELNAEYYAIIAANYKRQCLISPIHMLLSTQSINRLLSQNVLAEQYLTHIEAKKAEFVEAENVSHTLYKSYQAAINQNTKQQRVLNQEKEKIDTELSIQKNLVEQLSKKEASIRSELAESRKYRKNVNQRIESFIQQSIDNPEISTQPIQSKPTLIPTSEKTVREQKGNLPWPINGAVVSRFGRQRHATLTDVYIVNNGIDIGTSQSQSLSSIGSGSVAKVEQIKNGYLVLIESEGIYHLYSPVSNLLVQQGDQVSQNQSIGTVSDLLHFEIWEGKRKVDPQLWLDR